MGLRVLIALLLGTTPAAAASKKDCVEGYDAIARASQPFSSIRTADQLSQAIRHSKAFFTNNALAAKDVTSVSRTHTGGTFASGAIEVQSSQGVRFVKIYEDSKPRDLAHTFAIQNAMAARGLAPEITGYLPSKEIKTLKKNVPQVKAALDERDSTFGILMDPIEIVSEPSRHNRTIPPGWTTEKLEARVQEFEQAMSELRVIPAIDLQAAFTADGRLMLFDFDAYKHLSSDNQVWSLDTPGGRTMSLRQFQYSADQLEQEELARRRPIDHYKIDKNGKFSVRLSDLRSILGLKP